FSFAPQRSPDKMAASDTPLNPIPLDQKPPVPPSADIVDSETKMNGNAHELDPLFDDGEPPSLPNGDGHATAPQPEIPTKATIAEVGELGNMPIQGTGASPAVAPLDSDHNTATDVVAIPTGHTATTSGSPVEQSTSAVSDESLTAPAYALPSHTETDQGAA